MQSPFDTLAKGLIDAGLEPLCAVSMQEPVAMCEVLGMTLDDARREAIAQADADALSAMLDTLRRTRSFAAHQE